MKNILKVSRVLSWVNIIVWGWIILQLLFVALSAGAFIFIIPAFFFSSILLHSYAALKLRKSILNPAIRLDSQTPSGLRFIGMAASFFGIMLILASFTIFSNTGEILKAMQSSAMPQFKDAYKNVTVQYVRNMGVFILLIGLSVSVNVFLNLRLLRWYYLMLQQEQQQRQQREDDNA